MGGGGQVNLPEVSMPEVRFFYNFCTIVNKSNKFICVPLRYKNLQCFFPFDANEISYMFPNFLSENENIIFCTKITITFYSFGFVVTRDDFFPNKDNHDSASKIL